MKISSFIKKSLDKNILILMGGTLLSQLIPLAISPLLTRLFSPEEFGMFGVYFSITMIISVFITGRYEMAIILPEEDKDAANIVALSLLITTLISGLLFFLVLVFKYPVSVLLKSPGIENKLFLLPVTMFAIGSYQTFNYWNNRKEKYKRLALSRVTRSVNTSGASLVLGYTSFKSAGLILGDTIGQSAAALFLFFRTWKEHSSFFSHISKQGIIEQAKRFIRFPKFNVVSGLFEKMSGQFPVLMLSSFFGQAVTGWFSFSQRIISAPGAIIAKAVGDVFRQKANVEFIQNGNCKKMFINTFRQLSLLGLIPFALFFAFAPLLFKFLFGEKWVIAGEYSQIMTVMFYLQFVVSPLSNMFLIAGKQSLDLIMQLFLLLFVLLSFVSGSVIFNDPKICILLFTFVYSLKYLVELYLSYNFSKGENKL